MSDSRFGISIGVSGGAASEAEINRLKETINNLRTALEGLNSSNMRGSATFAESIRNQLQAAEARLRAFKDQLILTHSGIDTFNLRLTAAIIGKADKIKGIAKELTELDAITRAGSERFAVYTQKIKDVIAETNNLNSARNAAATHAGRQRDLESAFRYGSTQESSSIGRAVSTSNAAEIARIRAMSARAAGEAAVSFKVASVQTINEMLGIGRAAQITEEEVKAAFSRMGRSGRQAGEEAGQGFWAGFIRFLRGGRTPMSLLDEGMRGQHGAMVASVGAGLKAADVGSGGLAAGMGALVAVVGSGAIIHVAEQMADLNEQIKAGAEATGMSVHQYAQLQGALELTGVKSTAADASLRHFAGATEKAMANSTSEAAKALHALGKTQEEINSKGQNTYEMLRSVAEAANQFADSSTKAAALTALFGRGDENIIRFLSDFENLTQASNKFANSVDANIDTYTRMSAKLHELSVNWNTLKEEAAEPLNFLVNFSISGLDAVNNAVAGLWNIGKFAGAATRSLTQVPSDFITAMKSGMGLVGSFGYAEGLHRDRLHNVWESMVPHTTLDPVNVTAKDPRPKVPPFSTPKAGGGGGHPMFKEQEADIESLRQKLASLRADYQLYAEQQDATFEHQKIQARLQQADRNISPIQRAQDDYKAAQQSGQAKIQALEELAVKSAAVYAQMADDVKKQMDEDQVAAASIKNKVEATNRLVAAQKEYNKVIGEAAKAQTEFQVQIQRIQNQVDEQAIGIVEAHKQAVDQVVNKWGSAFDQIGDSLENTIQEAIKSAFIPQKPEYWFSSSTGPGGIPLMHAHRIDPTTQLLNQFGFSALGDLGKTFTSQITGDVAKSIFGSGTSSFGSGIASLLGFGKEGGFLGTGLGGVSPINIAQSTANKVVGSTISGALGQGIGAATQATPEITAITATTAAVTTGSASVVTAITAASTAIVGSITGLTGVTAAGAVNPEILGTKLSSGGIVTAASGMLTPRKFGTDSVLAALTPGERVLNTTDTAKLDRFLNGEAGQPSNNLSLHFHGPADAPSIGRWFKNMMSQNPDVVKNFFRQNALTPRTV